MPAAFINIMLNIISIDSLFTKRKIFNTKMMQKNIIDRKIISLKYKQTINN